MPHFISYWEKSVLLKTFDFTILGAGLIGKQIAIKIKKKFPSARVAMVDKMPISYGASTRNAGFACFGSVSEIVDDFKRSPQNEVYNLIQKRFAGIQQLKQEFGEASIGFEATGSFEVFQSEADFQIAESQYQEINSELNARVGYKKVFNLQSADNLKMNFGPSAIYNPYEGMLNSGLLNQTVNSIAHTLDIIPLYGLNIVSHHATQGGYTLISDSGMEIETNQLIIANNAFAKDLLPSEDVEPARGQIVITKPIDNLPFDAIFHADKGYIYFRRIDDRILIGGGRNHFYDKENTFVMQGTDNLKDFLSNYIKEWILPNTPFEIDMHWSGIMGMGKEKLPIVKKVDDHLGICVRMSGMGVALGPVLSDEVLAWY